MKRMGKRETLKKTRKECHKFQFLLHNYLKTLRLKIQTEFIVNFCLNNSKQGGNKLSVKIF